MADAQTIEKLLRQLNCVNIKVQPRGEIKCSCPFARLGTHGRKTDRSGSFSIGVLPGSSSGYNCMACGEHGGSLKNLLDRLRFKGYRVTQRMYDLIAWPDMPDPEHIVKKARVAFTPRPPREVAGIRVPEAVVEKTAELAPEQELEVLDEALLKRFADLPPDIHQWLLDRGLTDTTIKLFELGWHEPSRRISMPIRDIRGRLVGISGRALGNHGPKFQHSEGFHRNFYLYGEHLLAQQGVDLGVVVEGHFDAMYVHQNGYPAVALMGTVLSPFQAEKLARFMRRVVVMGDGDDAGRKMALAVAQQLGSRITVSVADLPDGKDPDNLDADELRALIVT